MEAKQVLEKFDIKFEEQEGWLRVNCAFHPDATASAGVNAASGAFNCFGCKHGGDIFAFVAAVMSTKREIIMQMCEIEDEDDVPVDSIPGDMVERWHQALLKNPKMLEVIEHRKGVSLETVVKFRLGLAGDRVSIPIKIQDGSIVNVRQWSPTDTNRKVINISGHGERRLFPIFSLDKDLIYITEGEFKAMILDRYGFNAISATGGASTWSKKWAQLFKDKDVVVIYDIDDPGRRGALAVCHSLLPFAKSIKNVLLPIDINEYPTGDVTDWFVKCNQTRDDLQKVIDETQPWTPTPLVSKVEDDTTVYNVTLAESSCAKHWNKFVEVEAVISAKTDKPYIIPKTFMVSCLRDQELCSVCPIYKEADEKPKVQIDSKDPVLLELINIKTVFQHDVLKKAAGIPRRCPVCVFNPVDSYNIEELRLIPTLKTTQDSTSTAEQVSRLAFYVGQGTEANAPYKMQARVCAEPASQYATLLVFKAEPSQDALSTFEISEENKKELEIFQCEATIESVRAKFNDIYEDLEYNVTRIFQRRDMHLVYDMVYHSVLYVPMQGRENKGWVEALILGDSSQGKSKTVELLMGHYGLGEKVDAKNATIPGLLGGAAETSKRWFIQWGRLTLNDRRLVVLEEIKGMETNVIAKMTEARSSGIVRLAKIESGTTTCRCRLLWLSNPRSQRQLCTYNHGIEAVKELMGALEDVRRFDLAIIVASGDVPESELNRKIETRPVIPHKYTSAACRNLILWTWSRKTEDIFIEEDAVDEILSAATKMSETFSSGIPLVEPADQRLKIARLSTAIAARLFSTDDGTNVVVKKAHVQFCVEAMHRIYSTKAFGYLEYSRLLKGAANLEDKDSIINAIKELSHPTEFIQKLLESNVISAADVMDWSRLTYDDAKQLIGHFVRKNALKRHRAAYVKTPAFLLLLKELQETRSLDKPEPPPHVQKQTECRGDF